MKIFPKFLVLFLAASPFTFAQIRTGLIPSLIENRTLTTQGIGQVTVVPDIVRLTVNVNTEDPNATAAWEANQAQSQRVFDALSAAGVADEDVKTTNLNINRTRDRLPNGDYTPYRYVVWNGLSVVVRDFGNLGDLLGTITGIDANISFHLNLDVSDRGAPFAEALKAAVIDARNKAEIMAAAEGFTLGEVQSIHSSNSGVPVPNGGGAESFSFDAGVAPGQTQVSTTVQVVYSIQ